MSATGFLDACGFTPASSGTGDFVVSAAITGYQTPASAGAVNTTVYSYRAESADKSQWEEGFGAYTVAGTTLARTTITANSSGGTGKISFTNPPNVFITLASADLINASLLSTGTIAASVMAGTSIAALLRNYIGGLILSTAGASATFTVAAGLATDSTNADIMSLASAISKTTGAWAVGTGNGGLDTSSIAFSTGYFVYLIKRPDTGVVDVLISLSATTPTMPTNYTLKRRIGWMRTDPSSHWWAFTQTDDDFVLAAGVTEINAIATTASRVSTTLTAVPLGIVVAARFRATNNNGAGGGTATIFTSLQENDVAPTTAGLGDLQCAASQRAGGSFERFTDTSANIGVRSSGTSGILTITSYGWRDPRGKDA